MAKAKKPLNKKTVKAKKVAQKPVRKKLTAKPIRKLKKKVSASKQPPKLGASKAVISQFIEAHNDINLDKLRDLLAPNFMSHIADFPYPLNREQYVQAIDKAHEAFSDLMFTIQDLISEGDKVVVHVVASGRHTGDYQGIPATGKKVEFSSIAIRRVKNGKIAEEWQVNDQLSLLQQLKL